jgi:hypothetical protein
MYPLRQVHLYTASYFGNTAEAVFPVVTWHVAREDHSS